jgi:hypothetical protein
MYIVGHIQCYVVFAAKSGKFGYVDFPSSSVTHRLFRYVPLSERGERIGINRGLPTMISPKFGKRLQRYITRDSFN